MRLFLTEIQAIDPADGVLKVWAGPFIEEVSLEGAKRYCKEHLGYCRVIGELKEEAPGTWGYKPVWEDSINFENLN